MKHYPSRICRHCFQRNINRPRGLCWRCFYTPGVIDLYPSTSKYARRGIRNFYGSAPFPEPTATLPGTPERVAVYESRAQRGEQLFHPQDARDEVGGAIRSVA